MSLEKPSDDTCLPTVKPRRVSARRQRHLAIASRLDSASVSLFLSRAQLEQRAAVASDPLFPIPPCLESLPKFLGWSRYEWTYAPEEVARAVGLGEPWALWNEERNERISRRRTPTRSEYPL